MSDRSVARRYARALYQEAQEQGNLSAVDEDMDVIRQSLQDSRELVRFFDSPVISREKKASVAAILFKERLRPLTFRYMQLLIEKQREDLFPEIVDAYQNLRDEHNDIVEATVTVAFPLSPPDKDRIQEAVEQLTGRHVRLDVKERPGIIGGIVVRVGDTVYDGSVYHQLESLREQLLNPGMRTNGAASA